MIEGLNKTLREYWDKKYSAKQDSNNDLYLNKKETTLLICTINKYLLSFCWEVSLKI